jgi:Ca2+-binding EF-hand superfamily protein
MKYSLILSLALLAAPAFAGPSDSGPRPIKGKKTAKAVVFTNLFNAADANRDGVLNEVEFGQSYGASDTPVVTRFRFLTMSRGIWWVRGEINVREGVYLEEFIRQNGGRRLNPNRAERFNYADLDQDGYLDPEEFVATRVAPAATQGNVARAFGKLDKNDDSLISRSEWGGFGDA